MTVVGYGVSEDNHYRDVGDGRVYVKGQIVDNMALYRVNYEEHLRDDVSESYVLCPKARRKRDMKKTVEKALKDNKVNLERVLDVEQIGFELFIGNALRTK